MLKLLVYDIISYLLKKRSVLIAALILIPLICISQDNKIDSLKSLIEKAKGINKFDPMVSLVRIYGVSNNELALKYAQEARQVAFQFGDTAKIVTSSRMVGQLLNRLVRPIEAGEILKTILPIAKRNNFRDEYKAILNHLALAYTIQARYDKALEINFQALILREVDKDYEEMGISLNNIGLVYFKLKNYPKALEYYNRALKHKRENNDNYDLDRLLINIGLCYNQLKSFSKAQEYFKLGFKQCGQNCSDQIKIEGKFGLGVSQFKEENLIEALKYFNESYLLSKKIHNERFQGENLIYMSHIYIKQKKNEAALAVLNEGEKLAIKEGYNQILIDIYKDFSSVYNQVNNYQRAAYYQNKYISIKDSVYSEALIQNLAKVQADFEERDNIAIIATKEDVIQRQRSLNIAIGIIACLACLLIFVLFHSNKVKKRVNQALSEAKSIIELKNKELDKKVSEKTADLEVANDSLSKVNEELDNFIYKTSHDIRGPLASLKGICNVALMDVKDEVALNYLGKLDLTAEHLNTILTRLLIINQINNSSMKPELINFNSVIDEVLLLERKKGLPAKLEIRRKIGNNVKFYSDKEFIRIILENLIDNAIKFYNDSSRVQPFVEIIVEQEADEIKVSVIDNGIGISEAKPDKIFQMFSRASERSSTGGIGLYITKTATEKLSGVVGLKTTPEGYTEFFVKFPLKPLWLAIPEQQS